MSVPLRKNESIQNSNSKINLINLFTRFGEVTTLSNLFYCCILWVKNTTLKVLNLVVDINPYQGRMRILTK